MTDQTQADTNAVQGTQPEPMPSSNQQTPESSGSPEARSQEVGQGNQPAVSALPGDAAERTRVEFEKLSNKYATEREKRLKLERMFDTIRPAQPQPTQNPSWYNAETGEVEVTTLNTEFNGLKSQLENANRTIQRMVSESDERQARAAYKAHPTLDPKNDSTFNEDFHKATVSYLANAYAEGRNMTFKQAADAIKSIATSDVKKAEEKGAQRALEQLTPKEQASLEANSRSDARQDVSAQSDLQEKTRYGDEMAIYERLKKIPSVGR